jgi:hypothetical protein
MADLCCDFHDTYRAGLVHQWNCPSLSQSIMVATEHLWIGFGKSAYASCLWCGQMLGKEKYDRPCQGVVKVELR